MNWSRLTSRNWSRVTSLEAWRGKALEAAWKMRSRPAHGDFTPSWPLDAQELASISIRWPKKYKWGLATTWVDPLRYGLARYVRVELADIPQTHKGIALIEICIRGKKHNVAIDYLDLPEIDEDHARRCFLYFKMQFASGGYGFENVVPGGYIPNAVGIYGYLPHVRAMADRKAYRYEVYGRFGLNFAQEVRRKACSLLENQKHFRWEGSLQVKPYCISLSEIAHSKICIDLPGKGDFCFRLADYMAVGSCVIAARHRNTLPVPLVEGKHIVYVKDDFSDLVDLCRFYLQNDDAREALRRNSRAYFDSYLHRDQLAAYYLHSCLKATRKKSAAVSYCIQGHEAGAAPYS